MVLMPPMMPLAAWRGFDGRNIYQCPQTAKFNLTVEIGGVRSSSESRRAIGAKMKDYPHRRSLRFNINTSKIQEKSAASLFFQVLAQLKVVKRR
jgi:hypothetical protein